MLIDSKENRSAFDKLIREVRTGQALAFTGAGTSAAVGYPTWPHLIEKLARRTRDRVGDNVRWGNTDIPIEVATGLDFLGVTTPNVKNSTFRPVWLRPEYKQAVRSPATRRAYGSDFRLFAAWCGQAGLEALRCGRTALAKERKSGKVPHRR
jgi:hypothetical protein